MVMDGNGSNWDGAVNLMDEDNFVKDCDESDDKDDEDDIVS